MNYARAIKNGAARDEALKRRNGAKRQAPGLGQKPEPKPDQAAEQKANEKP